MKVLIVEDSAAVAERLLELLREVDGLEIAGVARNVEETVELVARAAPDAIVLDLQIAGRTGLEVLQAVKAGPRCIAVIVLTNSASEPVRQACLEAGADYFLDKSNEFERLAGILAKIGEEPGLSSHRGGETTGRPAELAPPPLPIRRTGTR
jgi:DNA-binding NarL/FixJ family response regulator